jgi:hypothetical protein
MKKESVNLIIDHLFKELMEADTKRSKAQDEYDGASKRYYAFKEEIENEGYVSYISGGKCDWRKVV